MLRKAAGLSQRALAEKAQVGRSVIDKIESGAQTSASLDTLEKLAVALGAQVADLVEEVSPRGWGPIQPLIDRFEEQERGPNPMVRATPEEIAWLRSLRGSFWTDFPPTLTALASLVQGYRMRQSGETE